MPRSSRDEEFSAFVARAVEHSPHLGLDRLADVEQLLRLARRQDAHRRVEKVGLVEDLADRLCLIERGDGRHLDPPGLQRANRPA